MPGLPEDLPLEEPFELPPEELEKFRKVLRLSTGDQVAVLPNDGRLLRCELEGRRAKPLEVIHPETDAELDITVCLGMPRTDKLEESVRMGTEMGVARFEIFESQRSVVRWDDKKREKKLQRLESIAKEASEVCFRARLPQIEFVPSLQAVLESYAQAFVFSEVETVTRRLSGTQEAAQVVIGPEGGWAPEESELIGDRAVTLGPRVLRVDTAVAAVCSLLLFGDR